MLQLPQSTAAAAAAAAATQVNTGRGLLRLRAAAAGSLVNSPQRPLLWLTYPAVVLQAVHMGRSFWLYGESNVVKESMSTRPF
jgi:hypothetical protein